jgi:hypothetical protein
LVVFEGGDHMVFSGQRRGGPKPSDAAIHDAIVRGTTAFLDAHLRGDEAAHRFLMDGGYESSLGDLAARFGAVKP